MTKAQQRRREKSRRRQFDADLKRLRDLRAGSSGGAEGREGNAAAGKILEEKRVAAGQTRANLARKIGKTYQAVWNYEAGFRSPERSTAVALEREVGMFVGLWDE